MKYTLRCLAAVLIVLGVFGIAQSTPSGKIYLMRIDGAIGPATADFIHRGIHQAQQQSAQAVVIELDTPGGLDKSMRKIIKSTLASSVPVITYVSPSGARAASAGTFMLYASHIAAMAPGTNLGAASPVSVAGGLPGAEKKEEKKAAKAAKPSTPSQQDTMKQKVTKDAIAYIRSLAQMRNRNIEFAEKAVSEAATMTAVEAQQKKVIDLVAKDLPDLLSQIHGKTVSVQGKPHVINSKDASIVTVKPDWRMKFLSVITDPSVAYILLLMGIYGLFFEFANPGFVVPGVCGAIALILAMYAFQMLPINYAGLGLIILGVIFMVGEAFVPSFGALGFGGAVAFVIGSVLLFDTSIPGFYLAWPLIIAMAVVNALFIALVLNMAIRARTRKVVSGREALDGEIGTVLADFDQTGQAHVAGEIWQVAYAGSMKKGDKVQVIAVNGLVLSVKPVSI